MVARDCEDTLDDHAKFPSVYDSWLFDDNSETLNYWDFDLAGDEYRLPFPPDAVGVLYLVVTFDYWGNWIDGDGNVDCRVGVGWVDFVGGTEVITRTTVKVAIKSH